MARPITLFTGQWADLPFEEVAKLASGWGYDGLEIACWGDHFDPWAAVEEDGYVERKLELLDKHNLKVYAISNHLKGQAVCDDPIDERHKDILSAAHLGRRRARGRAPARGRGDEDDGPRGRQARRQDRRRLHRVGDLEVRRDVPAGVAGDGRRGLRGLRQPVEPDPRRLRRGAACGSPTRCTRREIAYDYWTTVRTMEAIGHREAFGLNWDPSHFVWQDLDPVELHVGLQGPDLPRRLQGREEAGRQRPQRPDGLAPAVGRPAPRLGLRVHRPRRRRRGRRASGCSTPSATTARSRSSGRTPAWTGSSARRRRWSSSAASRSTPPTAAFDAAFSTQS